jgi:restriction system protein
MGILRGNQLAGVQSGLSRQNNIQLIDGHQLVDLIGNLPVEIQDKLLRRVTAGDYTTPTCVQCGI